jgi:hypothetical protein
MRLQVASYMNVPNVSTQYAIIVRIYVRNVELIYVMAAIMTIRRIVKNEREISSVNLSKISFK